MRQALKKHAFPRILCAVVILIAFLTYKPGTFLSGWDTLHPEFDFPLNFKRLILGVWRGEQGLGAVAGHSHMADLPRVFILWASHFVVPLNTLRYLYLFLCLLLGPFGMYYLCVYLGKNVILGRSEATTPESADSGQVPRLRSGQARMTKKQTSFLVAFLTALFYLLNLSTLQQFYTPFEMFPTQYAFLPWIMLYSIKFLGEGGKKNLTLFALFTLFATPQAYAAHLWYAFFGV
ncbi:hypothetical protein HYT33_03715 [Candidatus Roizmanbacteria bacterium]|nr:hypothetical protein [Candidatus Roizmanbacteria bacterium]